MLRVTLLCVGRLKTGPEREIAGRYMERADLVGRHIGIGFDGREIDESRRRRPDDRRVEEAAAIRAACPSVSQVVVLDAGGDLLTSEDFAGLFASSRDDGAASLVFAVGGPDGLDREFVRAASRGIALGRMTWPHQLVRIMVAEQFYRAVTILANHPYHRA